MREITTHKVNGCNDEITLSAVDQPGHGGANHSYYARFPRPRNAGPSNFIFEFQNGPVAEVGTNGITHEVLLAVLIDRLEGFQRGPFACEENELALTDLRNAMHHLHSRTSARVARGVEGTHAV